MDVCAARFIKSVCAISQFISIYRAALLSMEKHLHLYETEEAGGQAGSCARAQIAWNRVSKVMFSHTSMF